jgi:hypothetical protein
MSHSRTGTAPAVAIFHLPSKKVGQTDRPSRPRSISPQKTFDRAREKILFYNLRYILHLYLSQAFSIRA